MHIASPFSPVHLSRVQPAKAYGNLWRNLFIDVKTRKILHRLKTTAALEKNTCLGSVVRGIYFTILDATHVCAYILVYVYSYIIAMVCNKQRNTKVKQTNPTATVRLSRSHDSKVCHVSPSSTWHLSRRHPRP